MKKEKKEIILTWCPNYDEISNYLYFKKDAITKRIITEYQEFVFSVNINDEKDKKVLSLINKAVLTYINDYQFAKELGNYFKEEKKKLKRLKTKELIKVIINFWEKYQEESLKSIVTTKWL